MRDIKTQCLRLFRLASDRVTIAAFVILGIGIAGRGPLEQLLLGNRDMSAFWTEFTANLGSILDSPFVRAALVVLGLYLLGRSAHRVMLNDAAVANDTARSTTLLANETAAALRVELQKVTDEIGLETGRQRAEREAAIEELREVLGETLADQRKLVVTHTSIVRHYIDGRKLEAASIHLVAAREKLSRRKAVEDNFNKVEAQYFQGLMASTLWDGIRYAEVRGCIERAIESGSATGLSIPGELLPTEPTWEPDKGVNDGLWYKKENNVNFLHSFAVTNNSLEGVIGRLEQILAAKKQQHGARLPEEA